MRGFHLATEALGILIHEIAHAACWRRPEERPALSPPEAAAVVEQWARQDAAAPPDPAPWFDDHGAEFIRMTLHVAHRAERLLGYGIVLLDVFDPDDYGLSGIYAYRNALGNEPAALKAEPFTAILETCPPQAVCRVVASRRSTMADRIASPTPEQRAAVVAALSLYS